MGAADDSVPFKICTKCHARWLRAEDFLSDPALVLTGYQANFLNLTEGLFLFNHSCHTTLAIKAKELLYLYKGPMLHGRATGGPDCPGHCLHKDVLLPCPAHCECAYVRDVLQIIQQWPKNT